MQRAFCLEAEYETFCYVHSGALIVEKYQNFADRPNVVTTEAEFDTYNGFLPSFPPRSAVQTTPMTTESYLGFGNSGSYY